MSMDAPHLDRALDALVEVAAAIRKLDRNCVALPAAARELIDNSNLAYIDAGAVEGLRAQIEDAMRMEARHVA